MQHESPVLDQIIDQIRMALAACESIARAPKKPFATRAKAKARADTYKAILSSKELPPLIKELEQIEKKEWIEFNPNAFIRCALEAYERISDIECENTRRDRARNLRARIRELANEMAELLRQAHDERLFVNVTPEHAEAIEKMANELKLNTPSRGWPERRPNKAAYLRAFMTKLSESKCMPAGLLFRRYEDGKPVRYRYNLLIARMAAIVLTDEVNTGEVESARKEFRMTVKITTEPES